MIGLSLSKCVLDMAIGKTGIKRIDKILTGERFDSPEEFQAILDRNMRTVWAGHAGKAMQIALELKVEGRIEQVRKVGGRVVPDTRARHWVYSKDDITWVMYPQKKREKKDH